MSGGILCKGVVLKVHRVINYNSMYIIIGYDINTPLMTMYEIITLCKHRMFLTPLVFPGLLAPLITVVVQSVQSSTPQRVEDLLLFCPEILDFILH